MGRDASIFNCDMHREQEALQQVQWGAQRAVQEANELLAGNDHASHTPSQEPSKLQTLEDASGALKVMSQTIRSLTTVLAHKQRCQHALEAHQGQHNQHEGVPPVYYVEGQRLQ